MSTPHEQHFRALERMYRRDRTNAFYQPRLEVAEGRAELVMPVDDRFFHAAGAVHGSIYFKALDDAAYFAASSLVEDVFLLTASFTIYLLRPVSSGEMRAVGQAVFRSSRLLVAESRLTDADGNDLARGSGTFVPGRTPLSPEIGYG
jgi:uncharacterized protein (TIGR00369 family)